MKIGAEKNAKNLVIIGTVVVVVFVHRGTAYQRVNRFL